MTSSSALAGRLNGEKSTLELLTAKPIPLALDPRLGFAGGARTDTSRVDAEADADTTSSTPPRDVAPTVVLDRRFNALNANETLSRLPASSSTASFFHTPPVW